MSSASPPDLEVAGVHPRAGDQLEEVEDQVALAEAVPEHRDRPELERGGAEVDEVGVDPGELPERHPHPRRLARDLELEQLLDREHEDELVVLEGDVVDARRVGDPLPPGLLLHGLLEPGVQVADHGREPDDVLAVQVDDQPEHPVRGRVVRAEVDGEDVLERRVGLKHGRDRLRDPRAGIDRGRFASSTIATTRLREADRLAADRIVLAQRWPSQSSSIRIRVRFGWPSKGMPIMSQASRSCQSAVGQTGTTVATVSPSSSHTWTRTRAESSATRSRW